MSPTSFIGTLARPASVKTSLEMAASRPKPKRSVTQSLHPDFAYEFPGLISPTEIDAQVSPSGAAHLTEHVSSTTPKVSKKSVKAGSHVRRKRKHKEVHTSNANASTVQYASAIEYSKMVDEVDVLDQVLLFFLFLCLRRRRRRRLIQRNNKSRPKRLWVREIFQKRQLFPFLSQHLPF